jgi:hypothetical protein
VSNILLFAQADADQAAGGFLGGLLALGAVFWLIALAATVFWVWMMVDVLTSSLSANEKILWFLVIFFLPLIGSLIYFFVRRQGRRR